MSGKRSSSAQRSRPGTKSSNGKAPISRRPQGVRATHASSSTSTLSFASAVMISSVILGAVGLAAGWLGTEKSVLGASDPFRPVLEAAKAAPYTAAATALAVFFAWTSLSLWAEPRGGVLKALREAVVTAAVSAPGLNSILDGEIEKLKAGFKKDLLGDLREEDRIRSLPREGLKASEIISIIKASAAKDKGIWASGQHSGTVYHGGDELNAIIDAAISRFAVTNPLHPDAFPALRKMDAEIVAMTLSLFSPTPECCGTTTSGGTESILLAVKAYRDRARTEKGVTRPEMVLPDSVHAAFWKGAHYFGVKTVVIPVDQTTFRVDPAAVAAAVTPNTVMIVGSAPNFPQGTVDPIPALAAIAKRHDIGMHVDCCLGSFMIPFARSVGGRDVPDFDFAVDGVTSISCDTHKYGFAPKGSSVIMWRSKAWRQHQYYTLPDWTGGIYATPTLAGSRPGANLAATWAVMRFFGHEGYEQAAREVFAAADEVTAGLAAIPELVQLGSTDHAVVAFAAAPGSGMDVYKVVNAMKERGWQLNSLQRPASAHLCVTKANASMASRFVADLGASVAEVKADPGKYKGGAAAVYGSTAMAPQGMLKNVAGIFMDTVYTA